jgi:hypothetical protein
VPIVDVSDGEGFSPGGLGYPGFDASGLILALWKDLQRVPG